MQVVLLPIKNQLIESNKTSSTLSTSRLVPFTKEEINKGIFFPAAGSYGPYNNGNPNFLLAGRRGVYWTGDPVNAGPSLFICLWSKCRFFYASDSR